MFMSGEMAQQFGALTALAVRDGFDSQHPHQGFTALITPIPEAPDTLFSSPSAPACT